MVVTRDVAGAGVSAAYRGGSDVLEHARYGELVRLRVARLRTRRGWVIPFELTLDTAKSRCILPLACF